MSAAADYRVFVEPLSAHLGGGFVAYAPELKGCLADGETPKEALDAVYDAIDCWIEGAREADMSVPQPNHATLRLTG